MSETISQQQYPWITEFLCSQGIGPKELTASRLAKRFRAVFFKGPALFMAVVKAVTDLLPERTKTGTQRMEIIGAMCDAGFLDFCDRGTPLSIKFWLIGKAREEILGCLLSPAPKPRPASCGRLSTEMEKFLMELISEAEGRLRLAGDRERAFALRQGKVDRLRLEIARLERDTASFDPDAARAAKEDAQRRYEYRDPKNKGLEKKLRKASLAAVTAYSTGRTALANLEDARTKLVRAEADRDAARSASLELTVAAAKAAREEAVKDLADYHASLKRSASPALQPA